MAPRISRRSILRSIGAASLAGTTTAQATNHRQEYSGKRRNPPGRGRPGRSISDWTQESVWDSTGCATEVPLQVMFPADTLLVHQATDALGGKRRFSERLAAENTARLQVPGEGDFSLSSGGFMAFGGDILGPWTRPTWAGIVFADEYNIDINRSAAARFLKRLQWRDGGFAPRFSFLGRRPLSNSMEATFYALDGLQRLGELDAETRQGAEQWLKSTQRDSGAWSRDGQVQNNSIAGTHFALRALETIDALSEDIAQSAGSFIRSRQREGGGFIDIIPPATPGLGEQKSDPSTSGPGPTKEVSSRSTAQALLILARTDQLDTLGDDRLEQHATWLASLQLTDNDPELDGAFKFIEDWAPITDFRANTRIAVEALVLLARRGITTDVDYREAIQFLRRCEHGDTGGIGMWPSYLTNSEPTAATMRTLSAVDAKQPADALASTYARLQQDSGRISTNKEKLGAVTKDTANPLIALAEVGRLDAIDVDAAAGFLASQQFGKGFPKLVFAEEPPITPQSDFVATTSVVFGLAAAGELDRIDKRKAGEYFASGQTSTGQIARPINTTTLIADTSQSLRALRELGQLDLIDLDASTDYLADLAADDGAYWPSPPVAGWAVQGLAAGDALDKIDTEATRTYLEENQYGSGGFAGYNFYAEYSAVERTEAATVGLSLLGGRPDTGPPAAVDSVAGGYGGPPSEVETVLRRVPGLGWRRTTVAQLPENQSDS